MGNLLFSAKGRINSGTFLKAAFILIAFSLILDLVSLAAPAMQTLLGFVSLVVIWPWIAIWVKRYHDDGKSGAMCLIPIIVMLILYTIAFIFLFNRTGISFMDPNIAAEMEALTEDPMKFTVPMIGIGLLIQLAIVFLFNAMIKSDPEENRFGLATN